jgi:TolB protein
MKLAIPIRGSLQNPAFSPDGKQISLTCWHRCYNGGQADVFTFNLATQQIAKIPVAGEANVSQPGSCWNSRGIIFSTDKWGPDSAASWDGIVVRRLFAQGSDQTWEPSWGPDFYVAERHRDGGGPGQIIAASLNHLDTIEELTDAGRDCRQPCVSPDGASIVFQEQMDDWTLILLDLASKHERKLVAGTDATFSRDGKRIVFSNNDGRLQVIDVRTGSVKNVYTETPYSGAPSFSPDDKQIAYEGGPSGDDGGPPTSIYLTEVLT